MKILVFGSLNIDVVMNVNHIVAPGETILASNISRYPGGKGLNQAIATARAGADVYMAGLIGNDGSILLDALKQNCVDSSLVKTVDSPSGTAYIQVDSNGQNSIIVSANANKQLTKEYIEDVISNFSAGDILLLQNEINAVDLIVSAAVAKGLRVYINPSPFDENLKEISFGQLAGIIFNEVEGSQMADEEDQEKILQKLTEMYPNTDLIMTVGAQGSIFKNKEQHIHQPAFAVKPVDTTAAGDTFAGYYLAAVSRGLSQQEALKLASKASSIAIGVQGATVSIPEYNEVVSSSIEEMKPTEAMSD